MSSFFIEARLSLPLFPSLSLGYTDCTSLQSFALGKGRGKLYHFYQLCFPLFISHVCLFFLDDVMKRDLSSSDWVFISWGFLPVRSSYVETIRIYKKQFKYLTCYIKVIRATGYQGREGTHCEDQTLYQWQLHFSILLEPLR